MLPAESGAQYANGYLFYVRQQNLIAQRFDPSSGTFSGAPVPVAEAVEYNSDRWIGAFTASSSGLGYLSGAGRQSQLAWFGRDGKEQGRLGHPGTYDVVSLSPDGQRVATNLREPNGPNSDIWIYELARGTATRLTFEGVSAQVPVWTRDGKTIAYTTNRHGGDLYAKASSGLGGEEMLVESDDFKIPIDWTRDGKLLIYMNFAGGKGPRLWIHQTAPEKKEYPLLRTNFSEEHGELSPDGQWLAYQSEETGKDEIFVVPFPSLSSKWQVSTNGGEQITWRRDGKELFYMAPDRKLMAVAVDFTGGAFKPGLPRELFATSVTSAHHAFRQYDVTPDGQKFVINTALEQNLEPITFYSNWESELKKK